MCRVTLKQYLLMDNLITNPLKLVGINAMFKIKGRFKHKIAFDLVAIVTDLCKRIM